MKHSLAKVVRVITAPPCMALLMICVIAANRTDLFTDLLSVFFAVCGLVIIPILAYPLSRLLPLNQSNERTAERKLAFICNLSGYIVFFLACLVMRRYGLLIISLTYLLSVLILTIINKCFKIKASGHACCTVAPLTLILTLVSRKWIPLCLTLLVSMVWASLTLKRHTPKELLYGGVTFLAAYALSSAICFAI